MLDKFKFFKGDKAKTAAGTKATGKVGGASKPKDGEKVGKASQSSSEAASRLANAEPPVSVVSNIQQGSPKLSSRGIKKPCSSGKAGGRSQLESPTVPNAADISIASNQRASGSASSIPSRTSSSTSVNSAVSASGTRRTVGSKIDGQRTPTSSASKLGSDKSATKSKGTSSSSSLSAIPTPGTGIPKPGLKPPKSAPSKETDNKVKSGMRSSQSRETIPARKATATGQPRSQGHVSKPPPTHPPPPTPEQNMVSVESTSIESGNQKQSNCLGSTSMPSFRHTQSKHPPPPPTPPREDSLEKFKSDTSVTQPDNVYTSVAVPKDIPQKVHQPVQRSASVGSQGKPPHPPSPRQTHGNMPQGPLYSASYACISPSKSQFPTIPEEPPQKPKKVDSDTQTTVSAVASAKQIQNNLVSASMPHLRLATAQNLQVKKSRSRSTKGHKGSESPQVANKVQEMPAIQEQSTTPPVTVPSSGSKTSINHSDSNVSTASESGNVSNSSSSKSNSGNNSASSTDSVIYRPSSCDELESGMESDSNQVPKSPHIKTRPSLPSSLPTQCTPPLDHISSLRNKQQQQLQKQQQQLQTADAQRKKETTFDSEVKTEEKEASSSSSSENKENKKESGEDGDSGGDLDIKPMQPMQPTMRSTPYSFLRSGSSSPSPFRQVQTSTPSNSRIRGSNKPLIDPSKLYTNAMKQGAYNQGVAGHHQEGDYSGDVDGYDVTAGYMSDGDILRSNQSEDLSSGYMSEGGASLYAKKIQQR